jgi:hypothetical protein
MSVPEGGLPDPDGHSPVEGGPPLQGRHPSPTGRRSRRAWVAISGLTLRSRLLLVGSILYLAVIFGVLLWRGISIEPEYVVLALVLVAFALGRGKQFIFDFVPFLILFLAYEQLGGLAGRTGIAPHDTGAWEQALFGGTLPNVWLQSRLYNPTHNTILDWLTMGFYFMHFVVPVGAGFILWLKDRRTYWMFVATLLVMSLVAFVFYLFFPTAPPWYQYPRQVHHVLPEIINRWGVNYYESPIFTFDSDKFAAFPSMHAAYPTLAAVFLWSVDRKLGAAFFAYSLCVYFSIVYLGEHYVVDILGAIVLVAVVSLVMLQVSARLFPVRTADAALVSRRGDSRAGR